MSGLLGKRALITGGARGIGRAIVRELAKAGVALAFTYHTSASEARDLEAELSAQQYQVFCGKVDIREVSELRAFVAAATEHLGPLDFFISNAGIATPGPIIFMSDQDWEQVRATNLDGVFYLNRLAAQYLLKQKIQGCILNISSVLALKFVEGQSNYSAGKAGVIGLTKALAKELAPYGVRVNAVAPGLIQTDMTAVLSEQKKADYLAAIPLQRAGRPEDIARVVSFLLSDAAAYITGQVLVVDGGMTL